MLLVKLVATQSCFFQHGSVSKITRYTHRAKITIRLTDMKVYLNRGSSKCFLYFKKKCMFLFIYCIIINSLYEIRNL